MNTNLHVIITVVNDPNGRKDSNDNLYQVFKLEAFYTLRQNLTPPAMSGWENNNSTGNSIQKYIAYADNLNTVQEKISTLRTAYWSFPPSD